MNTNNLRLNIESLNSTHINNLKLHAGKGFGHIQQGKPKQANQEQGKQKGAKKIVSGQKAAERLLDELKREDVRPVDIDEAQKGEVNYIQVDDWGSEIDPNKKEDLGNLKVKKQFIDKMFIDENEEFYNTIAKKLEFFEAQGYFCGQRYKELTGISMENNSIPFQAWAFKPQHYTQYLVDLYEVHTSLEDAIECARRSKFQNLEEYEDILSCFTKAGLARSEMLKLDMENMARATTNEQPIVIEPQDQASNYSMYIEQIGLQCMQESDNTKQQDLFMRLIANAISFHLVSLSVGYQIGAKAVEKLQLNKLGCTNIYINWPKQIKDPIKFLQSNVNKVGGIIPMSYKKGIVNELQDSYLRSAMILQSLAKTDQQK